MKKTRIILLLFSAMQLAGINNISANTESGLHLTTSNLKVKADGKELCTAELQQAIDRIAAQGGGQLTFTPGRYLTGGLMLRSGVQLYLEEGATLLGSTDPRHYRLPNGLSAPDNPDKVTTYALIAACGVEHVTLAGRATKGMAYMPLWRLDDVPEEIGKYPEFSMFGELPAWGFYVRHVNHITFRCVHLSLRDSDFRPAFVFDDVHLLTMEQVTPDESVFN